MFNHMIFYDSIYMIYMINMNTTLMYKEKKKYNINWWTKKLFSAFIFHFWWKGTNELM